MSSDPTTWGLQSAGWVTPALQEIQDSIKSDLRAFVDPDLDLDPDSPEGQVVGLYSRQAALLWEGCQALHDGNNPNAAEADQLDDVSMLSGTPRQGPRATVVVCQCTLVSGTTLVHGTAMVSQTGHPDVLFTPVVDYTAATSGTFDVTFECLTLGQLVVGSAELVTISAAVSGWTAVNNTLPGVTGSPLDTDDTLRLRREQDLSKAGTSTTEAIRADVGALAGVVSCKVLENLLDATDADGVPGHCFEVLVYGSGFNPTEIAQAIWEGKPAGIRPVGSSSATYVDAYGDLQTVHYSAVTTKQIWVQLALVTGAGYPGGLVVAEHVVAKLTTGLRPGDDVVALKVVSLALAEAGVLDATSYGVSDTGSGFATTNITLTAREIAVFDSSPTYFAVTP
jgi:hypothetical protein